MVESNSEIEQEIENILSYTKTSSEKATTEWRSYLEEALRYYNALSDWQSAFYFVPQEHKRGKTGELMQECVIDMECSLLQVVVGLWKPAFVSLRSCLETGVLLIYFSLPQRHAKYNDFFKGNRRTPSFGNLCQTIFGMEPFQTYDSTYSLKERIHQIYRSLSAYPHTKGWERYEGHLREITSGGEPFSKIPPLSAKEVWEKWLLQIRGVYQVLSLLFALATPTFCNFLKNEQLPRSEKFKNILSMMDNRDVEQLAKLVVNYGK